MNNNRDIAIQRASVNFVGNFSKIKYIKIIDYLKGKSSLLVFDRYSSSKLSHIKK